MRTGLLGFPWLWLVRWQTAARSASLLARYSRSQVGSITHDKAFYAEIFSSLIFLI